MGNNAWGITASAIPYTQPSVAPGARFSFPFSVTAPATPGNYPFHCQMNDSAHGSFGAITPLTINVVLGPPLAPTNLTAVAGNAQAKLSWTAPPDMVTSYNLKRSLTQYGQYTTVSTAGAVTGTTYTDTGLTNRTLYYYVVSAVNAYGESPDSAVIPVTPGLPDNAQFVSQSPPPATIRVGQAYPV